MPTLDDCADCGEGIEEADLVFCEDCGALLHDECSECDDEDLAVLCSDCHDDRRMKREMKDW